MKAAVSASLASIAKLCSFAKSDSAADVNRLAGPLPCQAANG